MPWKQNVKLIDAKKKLHRVEQSATGKDDYYGDKTLFQTKYLRVAPRNKSEAKQIQLVSEDVIHRGSPSHILTFASPLQRLSDGYMR